LNQDVVPHVALENAVQPPRARDNACTPGIIKAEPEHFQVIELPVTAPSGSGSHLWLNVQRTGMNTEFAARQIARVAAVAKRDVGYAGLKDRHAKTQQWFSIPGHDEVDALLESLAQCGLTVLDSARHERKLRRGALAGNRFVIFVRHDAGVGSAARNWAADDQSVQDAVQWLREHGAPNYFGPQRFGFDGNNLQQAVLMLCDGRKVRDRHRRGLYLSAARSALFNQVLAARVHGASWNTLLPGEAAVLDGSASFFLCQQDDPALAARLRSFDIHPSGPMYGDDDTPALDEAARVELAALVGCEDLMAGLRGQRMQSARRALRVVLQDINVQSVADEGWWLEFSLPSGAYATSIMREIFDITDGSVRAAQ
jgi:tRNA pseudouridine13 synthase